MTPLATWLVVLLVAGFSWFFGVYLVDWFLLMSWAGYGYHRCGNCWAMTRDEGGKCEYCGTKL